MRSLSFLLFILLFTSCDPGKRISRIIKRHPELAKADTIWRVDTVFTKGAAKDSTFHFYQHDTIILKQNNLTLKYFFNKDSTIYLNGRCKPDTIVKMYPVQVNSVSVAKDLKWHQKIKVWIFDNAWWLIALIWLLWKMFGKAIKAYFPFLNFL